MKVLPLARLILLVGFSSLLIHTPQTFANNKTRSYSNPIFRGLPIDATPVEWSGDNEQKANEDAANLFCQWQGYDYAISWSVVKNESLAERGTYRFSEKGGTPHVISAVGTSQLFVASSSDKFLF